MANNEKMEALNRLKVVLVEKGKTSRWLAEQLGKTEHTISRWCQNKTICVIWMLRLSFCFVSR